MINITAVGFVAEKPELQVINKSSQKVEFDVLWSRRVTERGEWTTVWERATFCAWGEDAERIATSLEKGSDVVVTGTQETSHWTDRDGNKKSRVRYRVTAWNKQYRRQNESNGDRQSYDRPQRQHGSEPRPEPRGYQDRENLGNTAYGNRQPYQQETKKTFPHEDFIDF